ncbi:unnamed protein product [Cercospora beticola]|nr:unnamed protein product [Cercospora beticola]
MFSRTPGRHDRKARTEINAKDLYIQQLEEQQSPQSQALSGRSHAGISSERGPLMSTAQCSPKPAVEKFVPALEHELAEGHEIETCLLWLPVFPQHHHQDPSALLASH